MQKTYNITIGAVVADYLRIEAGINRPLGQSKWEAIEDILLEAARRIDDVIQGEETQMERLIRQANALGVGANN